MLGAVPKAHISALNIYETKFNLCQKMQKIRRFIRILHKILTYKSVVEFKNKNLLQYVTYNYIVNIFYVKREYSAQNGQAGS